MGISAVSSYRGAQIFEAVGVSQALIDSCFSGTLRASGASGWPRCPRKPCAATTTPTARRSLGPRLPDLGFIRYKKDGEFHGYNRLAVVAMQKASRSGEYADYRAYRELVHGGAPRACGTSSTLCPWARPSRWTRWSRPRRSCVASLPRPCPWGPSPARGPRHPGGGHEPDRGPLQYRGGWRRPGLVAALRGGPFAGERANSKIKQVAARGSG